MPSLLELWMIFLTALLGSGHCIGMCGGIAASCTLASGLYSWRGRLLLPLYYSLGRVGTYLLLGALSGWLGSLQLLYARPGELRGLPMLLAGLFMVWVGLRTMGLFGGDDFISGWGWLRVVSQRVAQATPGWRALGMGVLTGLLPCSLHWAFQAQALASASLLSGVLILFAFALGTLPSMLAFAMLTSWLDGPTRRRIVQAAGLLMVVMGLMSLRRAWLVSHFLN
ncbi:MAG: sulfite exporter TauE/SafE family protein [Magnetococcales bacterium]|nr:sulfite exporter TauE/SafE family protein [Magnetococcales bacterium]